MEEAKQIIKDLGIDPHKVHVDIFAAVDGINRKMQSRQKTMSWLRKYHPLIGMSPVEAIRTGCEQKLIDASKTIL